MQTWPNARKMGTVFGRPTPDRSQAAVELTCLWLLGTRFHATPKPRIRLVRRRHLARLPWWSSGPSRQGRRDRL